ncbi:MAG: hypothetical protein ACOX9R_04420 [Armatimonadota bacterium]|jgi:hypothetical protein
MSAVTVLPDGKQVDLEIPDPSWWSRACGANLAGATVGTVGRPEDNGFPCIWDETGSLSLLETVPGCAVSINDGGTIVGELVLENGEHLTRLWMPGGGGWRRVDLTGDLAVNMRPSAISNEGVVVGYSPAHGALRWDSEEGIQILGTSGVVGFSAARDVNDRGEIVGLESAASGSIAMLWRRDEMIDLNKRIDPLQGWHLDEAVAISNPGTIACMGQRDDRREVVLLVPRRATG